MRNIPTYLHTPPTTEIDPPVSTSKQLLPFDKLRWEDFERLCLRLVRLESDVVDCRVYGVRGDRQAGIDLFALLRSGYYITYQCKRVKEFGPKKITAAISTFAQGRWYNRSKRFVLCTSESLASTQRTDAIQQARSRLGEVELLIWDAETLSISLKAHPRIVDDFFGRAWVKVFNGPGAAAALGERLDSGAVRRYRRELRTFYASVFAKHDPGILSGGGQQLRPLALVQRYTIPDVKASTTSGLDKPRALTEGDHLVDSLPVPANSEILEPTESYSELNFRNLTSHDRRRGNRRQIHNTQAKKRINIDDWLARNNRTIVLAGPGGGKSALLRFLSLDFLSDEPRLTKAAERWGGRLPVWVPFGRWTRSVEASVGAEGSLTRALESWFGEFDASDLWPLVSCALNDNRLLLLVDGLDEWTTKEAGAIAVQRLQVFVERQQVPAIVTSRPHGFERLPVSGAGWQVGHLAPLSDIQRKSFVRKWFTHWSPLSGECEDSQATQRRVENEVEALEVDLARTPDLDELSRIPLLLLLLVRLQREQARLPTSRFKAYEVLAETLLQDQPRLRRRAASLTQEPIPDLSEDDLRAAFARLAWIIQTEHPDGSISNSEARKVLISFLEDGEVGPAMAPPDARRVAREVVAAGQDTLGLLRPASLREVAFFHRSLQQFLASVALGEEPLNRQVAIIERRYDDPQWVEVLLSLFALNRRPTDIRDYVDVLRPKTADVLGRWAAERLLAEIAFGENRCPASLSSELAHATFVQIETGPRLDQRKTLLEIAIDGLGSPRRRADVVERLHSWFPQRSSFRRNLFLAIREWPSLADENVIRRTLRRGIHDEHDANQVAAAVSLCQRYETDDEERAHMLTLVRGLHDTSIRAAALYGAAETWPLDEEIQTLSAELMAGGPLALRVAAANARICARTTDSEDWRHLAPPYGIFDDDGYGWSHRARMLLSTGWAGEESLKAYCVDLLSKMNLSLGWTRTEIWEVLLRAFPGAPEIAELLAKYICENERPFLGVDNHIHWILIRQNFQSFPHIAQAVEAHVLGRNVLYSLGDMYAACAARTERTRDLLIDTLKTSIPHNAAGALLDGWGMKDEAVSAALSVMAMGETRSASSIGHLLPRIISDKTVCAERLVSIAQDYDCQRFDFVIEGAAELGDQETILAVADAALAARAKWEGNWVLDDSVRSGLIRAAPKNRSVRRLALDSLQHAWPPLHEISVAYRNDPELRHLILDASAPLPERLRNVVAEHLGNDEDLANELLSGYQAEIQSQPAVLASIGHHAVRHRNGEWPASLTTTLVGRSRTGGLRSTVKREASFAGLIIGKQLDALTRKYQESGDERPYAIRIADYHDDMTAMRELVLKEWSYIADVLQDPLPWLSVGYMDHDPKPVWEILARFAAPFEEARVAVRDYVDCQIGSTPLSLPLLQFLAETDPTSPVLLDECLKALNSDARDWQETSRIALLVASMFGGRDDVRARIEASLSDGYTPANLILAIVEGWPTSDCARSIMAEAGARECMPWVIRLTLGSHYGTSEWAIQLLDELRPVPGPARSRQRNLYELAYGARTLGRFLSRHPGSVEVFLDKLNEEQDPYLLINIPRLVAASVGTPSRLRLWAEAKLIQWAKSEEVPIVGYDLLAASTRSLHAVLLDIVNK